MIFQDPMTSLNPVMKIGRQVTEVLIHHLKMDKQIAKDRAIELLELVGVPLAERRFYQYPHQLSGGLRQRVAIAIALACEPQILIADEPTTALDVTIQAEILDLIAKLQKEKHMAMILISHDLGVVAGRTHETAVMYAGKIVEQAPTHELYDNIYMPYTRMLIDAIPRLSDPPKKVLQTIGGQPPDLIDPLPGCQFAPRCPKAAQRCQHQEPTLDPIAGTNHKVACWYPLSI
jgi:peptide/nickel transport system ATP-binding protein